MNYKICTRCKKESDYCYWAGFPSKGIALEWVCGDCSPFICKYLLVGDKGVINMKAVPPHVIKKNFVEIEKPTPYQKSIRRHYC